MLTEEHQTRRLAASLENLCHYQEKGEPYVESIIMGNETWVHKFTPEPKRSSMTWKHSHSATTNKLQINHLGGGNGNHVLRW
jgi:hypothetical protein